MISQLPKPKSRRQANRVALDFSDDDAVYRKPVNGEGTSNFHDDSDDDSSQDEYNSIDEFIDDGSIDDQYSSSTSTNVCKSNFVFSNVGM